MGRYKVRVTQVYRVDKSIIVEIDADSPEEAVEAYASGDAPCSSLPGWQNYWELENETVDLL